MTKVLAPGDVIGILGGGQLGRMLALAAARLGLRCHVYEPSPGAPAAEVCGDYTCKPYDDEDALRTFAASVDVITYEFENIPTDALDILEQHCTLRPGREALRVSQDRLTEKEFLNGLGLKTAPFQAVSTIDDLQGALGRIGAPGILKTRRLGYDGKGQARIMDLGQVVAAFDAMAGADAILEGFIDFTHEVSVIGARGADGQVACYDPGQNVHRDGILHTTTLPAQLTHGQLTDAILLTGRILNALDYVGVMGVELFVTKAGLVVNEIAPRVHNSGHWTQNGCVVDQFEQHIRAVAGWPLGDGRRHSDIVMTNLLGDEVGQVADLARDPQNAVHLYGKAQARPGRKMGHVNRWIGPA